VVTKGKNVEIQDGAVIGGTGFRYVRDPITKELKELPHIFDVILEDNVRVGANTTIDRGRWRNTVIGRGTKIDNLTHIGHNVIVGKNCLIHALVTLCGSCEIGDNCQIFSHTNIQPSVKICNDVTIGDGSIVRENITECGTYVYKGNGKMKKIA